MVRERERERFGEREWEKERERESFIFCTTLVTDGLIWDVFQFKKKGKRGIEREKGEREKEKEKGERESIEMVRERERVLQFFNLSRPFGWKMNVVRIVHFLEMEKKPTHFSVQGPSQRRGWQHSRLFRAGQKH